MSSTYVHDVEVPVQGMNPLLAPAAGMILYLGAVVLNLADNAGRPSEQDLTDWVVALAMAGVGVGVSVWASHRAMARGAESMAGSSLILGVIGVLTILVFWAGLPCVFGATALALGWAARSPGQRRSTPAIVGMLLGVLALAFGSAVMVVG